MIFLRVLLNRLMLFKNRKIIRELGLGYCAYCYKVDCYADCEMAKKGESNDLHAQVHHSPV